MRQLLQETANNKKAMEEKIKRLTVALGDIQQVLWNTDPDKPILVYKNQ